MILRQNSSDSKESIDSGTCASICDLEDINRHLREQNRAQSSLLKWRLSVAEL